MIFRVFVLLAVTAAAALSGSGCSKTEKTPPVKIRRDTPALTGKLRCPHCRKDLQKKELLAAKSDAEAAKFFDKYAPVWAEIGYVIAGKRSAYLSKKLLEE